MLQEGFGSGPSAPTWQPEVKTTKSVKAAYFLQNGIIPHILQLWLLRWFESITYHQLFSRMGTGSVLAQL